MNVCTSFCILFPVRVWSYTSHNKSQQLFLGSGGKWQSLALQDKEMVTSHGWDTKAMWRLFVYIHMMVWVVKYDVNYINSFRQFPKGSVSGYCIILHCCTWSQLYNGCLRVWFYRMLHHNVEKKEIFTRPQKQIVFPSYLPGCFSDKK